MQFYTLQFLVGGDAEKMKNPLYNGLAGGIAGAVSVLVTMPQDTVKTRMQSENAKQLYSGTLDCIKKILAKEGPGFFYSGTWPRMVRVSLDVAITFTVMPLLNQFF